MSLLHYNEDTAQSPVQHAFYKTFNLLHVPLAILAVAGSRYHLRFSTQGFRPRQIHFAERDLGAHHDQPNGYTGRHLRRYHSQCLPPLAGGDASLMAEFQASVVSSSGQNTVYAMSCTDGPCNPIAGGTGTLTFTAGPQTFHYSGELSGGMTMDWSCDLNGCPTVTAVKCVTTKILSGSTTVDISRPTETGFLPLSLDQDVAEPATITCPKTTTKPPASAPTGSDDQTSGGSSGGDESSDSDSDSGSGSGSDSGSGNGGSSSGGDGGSGAGSFWPDYADDEVTHDPDPRLRGRVRTRFLLPALLYGHEKRGSDSMPGKPPGLHWPRVSAGSCTVTEEVWDTTLIENMFCPTVTLTPTCPSALPCNEVLNPTEPWDQSHCHFLTITHTDAESYDFCATTAPCQTPLPSATHERCRQYKCRAPTDECGPDHSEVTRTMVSATITQGCNVEVYTGYDPCPVCPSCTVKDQAPTPTPTGKCRGRRSIPEE
ncbi:unnamed protein product [Parascedosporium putredinis]|uniref:Uncharacterized protein n=1 Tax=Parascedosporium putredinis TaxID=1442378 RepID=A0A9P1H4K6_9PEZI|nr:unnamed protein product [Parascedosporium putredinis]CAI7996859.1 unnamed protein product [Parascedosporium putredinis]